MGVKAEDIEDLENVDEFMDEEFEDTPESRGDVLSDDVENEAEDEAEDEPEEETEGEAEDEPEEEAEDEPEEEAEDEPEEEQVPEADLGAEPSKPKIRVPKERLDAEIARRRELEEKLAAAGERSRSSERKTSRMDDISARMEELDSEISEAMLEGDSSKLKQLRAEERKLSNEVLDIRVSSATSEALYRTKYELTLEKVEEEHPALNPDSDEFDQEFHDEVAELKQAYELTGNRPETALKRAVSLLSSRYEVQEEELPEPEPEKKPALRSTKTPRKRNQRARDAQPPSTSSRRSAESTRIDVMSMTEDQIEALDDKKLRDLRGDYVQ